MRFKKLKSLIPTLALGAAMFSHEAKAGQRPIEGANLVCTTIEQNGTFSIDYANTFMGATLAPTEGLDIVTDVDFDEGKDTLQDGRISVARDLNESHNGLDFEQSLTSQIETARIRYHKGTGTALLGFSASRDSQVIRKIAQEAPLKDISSTNTDFLLRVRTDEQLRTAQDWLLASMNKAGHGAASEALWKLFSETVKTPLLKNLTKEAGHSSSYHFTPEQLNQMKTQFDKTGVVSAPQNIARVPVQATR